MVLAESGSMIASSEESISFPTANVQERRRGSLDEITAAALSRPRGRARWWRREYCGVVEWWGQATGFLLRMAQCGTSSLIEALVVHDELAE